MEVYYTKKEYNEMKNNRMKQLKAANRTIDNLRAKLAERNSQEKL